MRLNSTWTLAVEPVTSPDDATCPLQGKMTLVESCHSRRDSESPKPLANFAVSSALPWDEGPSLSSREPAAQQTEELLLHNFQVFLSFSPCFPLASDVRLNCVGREAD